MKNKRSHVTHGGVAILIKHDLLTTYNVRIISNHVDGLLIVRLLNKTIGSCTDAACVYIPPAKSNWCNSDEILEALTLHIYTNTEINNIFVLGDFNARIGSLLDHTNLIDKVPTRVVTDHKTNSLGQQLIEFICDNKLIILNGRFKDSEKYTCIHNGNSVVDYFLCNLEHFEQISDCKVIELQNLISEMNHMFDVTNKINLSDHNIIVIECKLAGENVTQIQNKDRCTKRIYDYKHIPDDFMKSDKWKSIVSKLIAELELLQSDLDVFYDGFIKDIFLEIDEHLDFKDVAPGTRKRFKYHKPFWNKKLTNLWKTYSKLDKNNPQYKTARNAFDRALSKAKRLFYKNQIVEIECANMENPQDFWEYINKLGPRKNNTNLPNSVEINGELISDNDSVINKWKSDFENLYRKPEDVKSSYDKDFFDKKLSELHVME